MGRLFSAATPPKPKQVVVAPATPQTPAQTQPSPAQLSPADSEQQRRQESLARQRAGRAGTIATSPMGLTLPAEWTPQRKTLLGE